MRSARIPVLLGYNPAGLPKHEQIPGARWKERTPKRIVRWLLRFLAWSTAVTLIALLLVAVVAFFVYLNRARIVNDALALFVEPFEVTVESIDLYPIGEVTIQNLTLSPKGTQLKNPTISVPAIKLHYEFQRLRRDRQLKSVHFAQPVIRINEETLAALAPKPVTSGSSPTPLDFARFAVFTESLALRDGTLFLELDGLPELSGKWSLETPAFTFDEGGDLITPIALTLSSLKLGSEDALGEIGSLTTGLKLRRDLSRFEIPFLHLSGIDATITPEWFQKKEPTGETGKTAGEATPTEATEATGSTPALDPATWVLRDLKIGDSTISLTGFDGSSGGSPLPDLTFDTQIELRELHFTNGKATTPGPVVLELSNLAIGPPENQLAAATLLRAEVETLETLLEKRTFSAIHIEGPEVVMTDETLARCRSGTNAEEPSPPGEPALPWIIQTLVIEDGRFVMRDAHFGETAGPHLETALSGTLRDLRFGGEAGFASEEELEIRLSRTRLRAPGISAGTGPLLSVEHAEIAGKWSEFHFDNTIQRLVLDKPVIQFTDETLGTWLTAGDQTPGPAGPPDRPVYKIADLKVTDGTLAADSKFAKGKVPKLLADFSISTKQEAGTAPFAYDFVLENLRLRNHPVAGVEAPPSPQTDPTLFPDTPDSPSLPGIEEAEVLSIRRIDLSATAEELQRTRQIGSVKLTGAILRVGRGLKSIVDAGTSTDPPPESDPFRPAAAPPTLPTWMLNEVEITRSQVRFEALIPQISGLEFAIETKLTNIPLSPDGLLAEDKIQKVELAGIEIKDPYNSFITVAFLPTIFVEFSLAGLANQQIEKIDLIGPALHVGQGLFWWIDYQRKFREQNEGASVGIEDENNSEGSPDWEIKTLNATAGKIVIAPTGIPIGMVPFPFNATTNMKDGRIELKLNIPDEDGYVYRFPDYEVDLYGLRGNIEFNVPIQQVSNNIVQVFELDRFIWKDYEAENLFLSVTFDENGVYGELGGEAYGGYAQGGFNFYLNDPGKWDAWVAGTEMDTRPITQVLVPDNFEMEGLVSLKLISEGRDKVLGESTGEIQTVGPGWFDVTKLDAILEELPEEWNSLQRSLTELGLIALKRFDYDKGAGSLYLLGQEGRLDLRFTGPYGTRELNLHLHDNRNTTSPVNEQTDTLDAAAVGAETTAPDP